MARRIKLGDQFRALRARQREDMIQCRQEKIKGCVKLLKRVHSLESALLSGMGDQDNIRRALVAAIKKYTTQRELEPLRKQQRQVLIMASLRRAE